MATTGMPSGEYGQHTREKEARVTGAEAQGG